MMNSPPVDTKLVQINLHHARAASANITQLISRAGISIALIQEPWAPKEEVLGLTLKGHKVIWCKTDGRPRAALAINNNIKHVCLSEFLTRDLVAVEANILVGGASKTVVIASAYFAGEKKAPPEEVAKLALHCKKKNIPLLIGCDANAHSQCWGSSDTNERGESLLDFLIEANLTTFNMGNRPTFVTAIREEVLDITIGSNYWCGLIHNWRVSPETSLSDHKIILFSIRASMLSQAPRRDPRCTNWVAFESKIDTNFRNISRGGMIMGQEHLDHCVNEVNNGINDAFRDSCKLKSNSLGTDAPWWNDHLRELKQAVRNAERKKKKPGGREWFKWIHTHYTKEIRKATRASYRRFCEQITETPAAARLHKALGRDRGSTISTIRKPDGSYTENEEERALVLLNTHFPGSTPVLLMEAPRIPPKTDKVNWELARKIITHDKVDWAIRNFLPLKSPGPDGIFPCLLQKALPTISGHLLDIFKASLATGLIPEAWKAARVVFMPKAGKKDTTHPKSLRPLSLTPFSLKAMEKIVDNHIRTTTLKVNPLHYSQHAYLEGRSTETALYKFVSEIHDTLENKEVCITLFLDMEGAFDNTSHQAIERSLLNRGVEQPITEWIMNLLRSRRAEMEVGDKTVGIQTTRGCPQGGVLSPLLWSLVVDDLLQRLTAAGIDCQGYADDIELSVRGKISISEMCSRVQLGLNICKRWCQEVGLNLNPDKTGIVIFTRKLKLPGWTAIMLGETEIKVHKHFKYLGVILDNKLTWNPQIDEACAKATKALMVCNRLAGKNWGCSPKILHWMYIMIVRPILTYGAIAWADKLDQAMARAKVDKIQRLACRSITSAMKSCPTRALEVITGLIPLHLHMKELAIRSLAKFTQEGFGPKAILKSKDKEEVLHRLPIAELPFDTMKKKFMFERRFKIHLSNKNAWESVGKTYTIQKGTLIFYTDGSKTNEGTGAGVFGPRVKYSESLGMYPNICQAELHAIERCAAINLNRGYNNKRIAILSDSQAAIKALSAYVFKSKLAWECCERLNELGSRNEVSLYWVPGHRDIFGNDAADSLARKGSATPFNGPEPFCGINIRIALDAISKSCHEEWRQQWLTSRNCRQAKRLLGPPDAKRSIALLSLPRNQLRVMTAMLTGHCKLRRHLTIMGLGDDRRCRFCKSSDETPEHLITSCVAITANRVSATGRYWIGTNSMKKLQPSEILDLLERCDLMKSL